MKRIISCIVILLVLACATETRATHTAGGELVYELVPGTTNQYLFTFKFYRACAYQSGGTWQTSSQEPATFQMCYFNSCGTNTFNITLNKVQGNIDPTPPNAPVPNGTVMGNGCDSVTTLCAYTPPSSAPAGTQPGFEEWWYQGTVTLNSTCNFWTFYVQLCCRNNGIINVNNSGSQNIYVECTLDNSIAAVNSNLNTSARFTYTGNVNSIPIPYVCINSPYVHNGSGTDPDGDSLVYETIYPVHKAGCNINATTNILIQPTYNILNTGGNPLSCANSYNLNTTNGVFAFTPNQLGQFVISQRISEYRNGQLIGSVMRDMQVVVDNCVPMSAGTLLDSLNVVGGNAQNDTVRTCPGANLNFCFDVLAPNGIYILSLFDNHATDFPGSTIAYSNLNDSTLHVCLNWTSGLNDTGLNILQLTVKDSLNCQTSPATVQIPIWVNKGMKSSNDTTICIGNAVQFNTVGNGNYLWTVAPGGSGLNTLSCTDCPNPIATPTMTTTYIVTDTLCNFVDSVTVTVLLGPDLTITPDTTTCSNTTLQLQVNTTSAGTFTYSWSPATNLSSATIPNPVFGLNGVPTNYTVTVASSGQYPCPSTATVNVDVLRGYNISNNDTTICDGDAVQIFHTGGNPKYTYNWTPATFVSNSSIINPVITPTPAGVYPYSFTASYPGCPDSTQTLTITVEPVPTVDAGNDVIICRGDTVHLQGSVSPAGVNYTYSWAPGADLDNNTILNPVFSGLTPTTLVLTATTPAGCSDDDAITVSVPSVDFLTIDGDRSLCPGQSAQLLVAGGFNYLWWPDINISATTGNTVTVNPYVTTIYYVTGNDINGCRDTVKAVVEVNPEALLEAGENKTIYPGESVELMADGNCSQNFNWFPPNGLSATNIKNPIASPSVTTQYVVSGQTEDGCNAIDTVTVIVLDESVIELPNAFSPGNGSSVNDELRVMVKGIAKLNSFRIYDRWGVQVFSTTDITKGWNGQYNGKPQPMGVYVVILDVVTSTGKRVTKQGNVTLVR